MRKLIGLVAVAALSLGATGHNVTAAPTPGGLASDNVEWVSAFPLEPGTATGVDIVGKTMFLTSWKNFSIYDISDPLAPELLAYEPLGFQFENEDVSTNGKILLFSESTPRSILHVWDIEDKTNPVEIAQVPGAGDHTTSCILKCKWAYGSDGAITDLRDPANPKLMSQDWHQLTKLQGGGHDVEEFKNGFLITSPISAPFQLLDVRDPLKPKVLATGKNPDPQGFLFHSGRWPNKGKDKFILMQGERNVQPTCDEHTGPFMTFDATKWKKTKSFTLIDTYRETNGTFVDGDPPANGLGCSAHWFTEHPTYKNGGLVAMGYYEHGTRFFDISSQGKIKEVGWFMPYGGSTSAAYWINKEIVYAVDYTRGIDILRYTGKP